MLLNRGQILTASDLKSEDVEVPEWGGTVRIACMSGFDRDRWEASLVPKHKADPVNIINIRARLLSFTAVDEQGDLLFSLDDAEALGKKSSSALDRCVKVAQRLNGLGEDAVQEARGNS